MRQALLGNIPITTEVSGVDEGAFGSDDDDTEVDDANHETVSGWSQVFNPNLTDQVRNYNSHNISSELVILLNSNILLEWKFSVRYRLQIIK